MTARDRRNPIAAAGVVVALLLGFASLAGCGMKEEGVASFEKPTPPTAEETRRMQEALQQVPGGGVPDAGIPR